MKRLGLLFFGLIVACGNGDDDVVPFAGGEGGPDGSSDASPLSDAPADSSIEASSADATLSDADAGSNRWELRGWARRLRRIGRRGRPMRGSRRSPIHARVRRALRRLRDPDALSQREVLRARRTALVRRRDQGALD